MYSTFAFDLTKVQQSFSKYYCVLMAVFTLLLSMEAEAINHPAVAHHVQQHYHKKEAGTKKGPSKHHHHRSHHSTPTKNSNRGHRTHGKNAGSFKISLQLNPSGYSVAWNITGIEHQFNAQPYSQFKGEISSPPPRFA